MKKIFAILFAIISCGAVFTGCGDKSPEENKTLAVYSFSGENEQFAVSDGVIVLTDAEEIFYVGSLAEKPGQLADIATFTITFYVLSDDGKEVLLSNSFVDETGKAIGISGMKEMKIAGDIPSISEADIDEMRNNLYCELETADRNGIQNKYLLQLTLQEIYKKNK
ncbi:MAG: hypothetical protein NC121_16875 [Blautia sp.]|nr:hypothetical protein [Blautia sp.]